MAAGSTYNPIATNTLGSNAASYTFTSIPGTYTDLVIVVDSIDTSGGVAALQVRFNGDTGTNYSRTALSGDGTTASSDSNVSSAIMAGGLTSGSVRNNNLISIMNYASTSIYKTALFRGNVSNALVRASAGLWRSTAAITSIELISGNGSFSTGSIFTLYGIKAA